MNFYIKQNSVLPNLKMKLYMDGRLDYKKFHDLLENATATFSMKNTQNGTFKIINKECEIVEVQNVETKEYYIQYKWSINDTLESGQFEGQFRIDFLDDCSYIIAPVREKLYINILPSFTKSEIEENNTLVESEGCLIYCDEYQFTGGTVSGSTEFLSDVNICEGDLYVHNIIGCSPITINNNLSVDEENLIISGQTQLLNSITGTSAYFDEIYSGNTNLMNLIDDIANQYSANTFTTGVTLSGNTLVFERNDNNEYSIDLSPFKDDTNTFTTGSTFDSNTKIVTFNRNDGNDYTLDLSTLSTVDTFVTGFTYDNQNTFTIEQNEGQSPLSVTMNDLTLNSISATTISGDTIFSGGTLLQTIIENIVSGNQITGTTGSVAFFGTGNTITQDNSNLFWDNTNKRLSIGTNSEISYLKGGTLVNPNLQINATSGNNGRVSIAFENNSQGDFVLFNKGTSTNNKAGIILAGHNLVNNAAYIYTRIYQDVSANQVFSIQYGATTRVPSFNIATGNRINIAPTTQNVGFGLGSSIATPSAKVEIRGQGTTSSTFGLQVHDSTGTNNAFVVRDDTRVGIGTNAPATRFHVEGISDERIRLSNGGNNLELGCTSSNNSFVKFGSGLLLRQNGTSTQTLELVGVGTNPITRLDLRGGTVGNTLITIQAGGANNTSILDMVRGTTTTIRLVDNNLNDSYFNTTRSFVFGGTARSSASALVEMISATQGFLPPRNADPATNIATPATGLIVYNTTTNTLDVRDNTQWKSVAYGGYIVSGSTEANLLENTGNWDINGDYIGTAITGTYQGQKHYNNNYFFEAVADNLWIRLLRG